MKKTLALLALAACLAGCTEPKHTAEILAINGYTNVQITGYAWFACSKDDWYHTGFTALGPTGLPIKGCVCSGLLFKNSTIRFE